MSFLNAADTTRISQYVHQFGLADRLLSDIAKYEFDLRSVESYDEKVKAEIASGINDLRGITKIRSIPNLRSPQRRLIDLAINGQNAIERDQAVWDLIADRGATSINTLVKSIETAPTRDLAISGMLALHKVAHHDPALVIGFLNDMLSHSDVERSEWAKLHLVEMAASLPGNSARLCEPCSARDFVYDRSRTFDVTMPLVFHCHAYTKLGPTHLHTVISPAWFSVVFGRAMACVRQETFYTNLVLEKRVDGLHADGSPHYEHFPFCGTTTQLSPGVFRHNYWAELHRPYYTSGRTELVTTQYPVLKSVPMTFCRIGCTYAPDRYRINGKPIPESVRGVFFGYGHIEPRVLVKNRFNIAAGDFQLSSTENPATGKPANTYFYGTFFGKLADWDGDGKLELNTRPIHCDSLGNLDYNGDGTMGSDPVRPHDWLIAKELSEPAAVLL
jgi:hypothetical protein